MSIRALFSTFFLMLLAGCIVRAQSPDAAPAEVGARDAIGGCNVDAPVRIGCSTPEEGWDEVCDPVCQTGDCNWCTQKCTYGIDGKPYCGLKQANEGNLNDRCIVTNDDGIHIDNCAPGLVCLRPSDGDANSYCFRPCRLSTNDCKQGDSVYECAYRPLAPKLPPNDAGMVLHKVLACNPSPTLNCKNDICCDPTKERRPDGGSDNANCKTDEVCRLLNEDKDRNSQTTCDLGTSEGIKSSCSSNADCAARYACIFYERESKCRQVCTPGAESRCFSMTLSCEKHGEQYGFCIP